MFVVDDLKFLVLSLLIFAYIGSRRGWQREVVTLTIILFSVLVLLYNADAIILIFNRLPRLITVIAQTDQGSTSVSATRPNPTINDTNRASVILFLFGLFTLLAYEIGRRVKSGVLTRGQRAYGALTGMLNGYTIVFFTAQYLQNVYREFDIRILRPTPGVVNQYLVLVFFGALFIILLLLSLASHRPARAGGKAEGGRREVDKKE